MHAQGGIQGGGSLITYSPHTPQPTQGSMLHRIQHRAQLIGRVGHQRVQRLAKGVAQPGAFAGLLRIGKVNQRGDVSGTCAGRHQAAPMPGTRREPEPGAFWNTEPAVKASIRSIGRRARSPSAGSM